MEPCTGDIDVRSMLKPVVAAFAVLGLATLASCSGHSEDEKAAGAPAAAAPFQQVLLHFPVLVSVMVLSPVSTVSMS